MLLDADDLFGRGAVLDNLGFEGERVAVEATGREPQLVKEGDGRRGSVPAWQYSGLMPY